MNARTRNETPNNECYSHVLGSHSRGSHDAKLPATRLSIPDVVQSREHAGHRPEAAPSCSAMAHGSSLAVDGPDLLAAEAWCPDPYRTAPRILRLTVGATPAGKRAVAPDFFKLAQLCD